MPIPETASLNIYSMFGHELIGFEGGGDITDPVIVPFDGSLVGVAIHVSAANTVECTFDFIRNTADDLWDITIPAAHLGADEGDVFFVPQSVDVFKGDMIQLQSNANANAAISGYCTWILRR